VESRRRQQKGPEWGLFVYMERVMGRKSKALKTQQKQQLTK
jgi:hypothetical protein